MDIALKNEIKVDKNFINELITQSWEDSVSLQNQINSIDVDSAVAAKVVKLLKDLLISYYIFTGCLENLETEPIEPFETTKITEPESASPEIPNITPKVSVKANTSNVSAVDILSELDNNESEPFEYFVEFDEPTGEPLTDDDLYS